MGSAQSFSRGEHKHTEDRHRLRTDAVVYIRFVAETVEATRGDILRYNELARNQGTNGRVDRGELDIGEVPDGRESNADGDYDRVLNA
ncbi:hypothetical protein [Natrinema pallidum]|uniref:Uncharacterized protein n=1 Tax=Natrinema pallidum TaxID=69527 RepID=A0A4P9TJV0_9EURY|nr:hypothetical protein [Natrinema pallidum]QCW05203.1 hypothetical protein FGF80_18360 [Natrinema pallidum]